MPNQTRASANTSAEYRFVLANGPTTLAVLSTPGRGTPLPDDFVSSPISHLCARKAKSNCLSPLLLGNCFFIRESGEKEELIKGKGLKAVDGSCFSRLIAFKRDRNTTPCPLDSYLTYFPGRILYLKGHLLLNLYSYTCLDHSINQN